MKAAQINQYGGPEVVQVSQVDTPATNEGQVLVKVNAAALNPFDKKMRSGNVKDAIPLNFPVTLGADFAGVVSDVGNGVINFKAGDEVYGSAIVLNGGSGALAEFAAANSASISIKPSNVDFGQAAAVVLVGVSAMQALDQLSLSDGQKVLIHGGAGGIGSAAIQYAKHLGAYVATTVSQNDKDFVLQLGADETIDYENQKFEDVLHDYDAVFDTIGGETYSRSFTVLKKGGTIISMVEKPNEGLTSQYGVIALMQNSTVNTTSLDKLKEMVEASVIIPQIDKEFSLDQTTQAFKHLETGHPKGKVVVKIR